MPQDTLESGLHTLASNQSEITLNNRKAVAVSSLLLVTEIGNYTKPNYNFTDLITIIYMFQKYYNYLDELQ